MIELNAETIHGFTSAFLMSKFDNPVPTPDFHLKLWELMCTDQEKVAVAAPRGHAKSTAVTHSYVLANLCFRKAKHIMLVSSTERQAVDFLRDIKMEILENDLLKESFGIAGSVKDRETEFIGKFADGNRFRFIVKGAGQDMRGAKWMNTRPDLVVCDDLENDEAVMNEERRTKFRAWFLGALMPIGGDFCKFRVVGTILHMDSLLENLMPEITARSTVSEELIDYTDEEVRKKEHKEQGKRYTSKVWKSYRFRAHNEDYSEILWPEKFHQERLERIRQDYLDQGFPEGYSQEYLNYPIDETNAMFRLKDFRDDDYDGPVEHYIACDLAISEKDQRAFTVFVVCSVNHKQNIKVVEVSRFRGDSLAIIDEMFRLESWYKPACIFVEQENIARALGPVINKEMESRDQYFTIEKMTASQDKIKRARPLQARMRAGKVRFDMEASWFPDLQAELCHFPRGKYMDQVDALSWVILGLDKINDAPTRAELEDSQWDEDYHGSYYANDFGASAITGY